MFKKLIITLLLSAMAYAGSINIAVAANVSYAMDELIAAFNKKYPDTKVQVTLSSSGKLTAQIKNGAPYTLFMAANMKYPNALLADSLAVTKPVIYAQGSLAILTQKPYDLTQGLDLVKDAKIEKIAIANPKTAPYGKAAIEAFKKAGVYEVSEKKLVYAETITQTVMYALKATDLGIIAKSSLYSSKMKNLKEGVNWISIDTKLYTPIDQGIVILKNGENNREVKAFYDFILSSIAKDIFERYGYLVP